MCPEGLAHVTPAVTISLLLVLLVLLASRAWPHAHRTRKETLARVEEHKPKQHQDAVPHHGQHGKQQQMWRSQQEEDGKYGEDGKPTRLTDVAAQRVRTQQQEVPVAAASRREGGGGQGTGEGGRERRRAAREHARLRRERERAQEQVGFNYCLGLVAASLQPMLRLKETAAPRVSAPHDARF
jgi:hypothetical protein